MKLFTEINDLPPKAKKNLFDDLIDTDVQKGFISYSLSHESVSVCVGVGVSVSVCVRVWVCVCINVCVCV